jgi:hypothetical protein
MANEELVEKVADEIEEVAYRVEEVAEATRRLTGREVGFFIAGAGIGVAIGFTVGFRIAEKRLQTKYSKLAEDEISEMREHYQKKAVAAQEKPPIEVVIEERHERYTPEEQAAIDEVNAQFPAKEAAAEEAVVEAPTQVNVFNTSEWDYSVEVKQRRPDVPYIIHYDEFKTNESGHEQLAYIYYEQDDVLVDTTSQTQIEDMDEVIGLGNLGRWGHGSPNDENVVHIRNEHLQLEFEVCRDPGSYEATISRHIRHSSSVERRRRPIRGFDDD